MVTFVTVNAEVSADDVLNAIMDQCGDEALPLGDWLGRFGDVSVDAKIDQEDAIAELPDERVKMDYRERFNGAEIEIEREFIDALNAVRVGDMDIARGLFGRMFQAYPAFQARVDEAIR